MLQTPDSHAVAHSSGTARPSPPLPANACDAHLHILDPRFTGAGNCPPGMTLEDYRRLQTRLGTRRAVFVQAKRHGTDPRCLLDALERMGGYARGVAVVNPSVSEGELLALNEAGVRGLRFSLWNPEDAVARIEALELLAWRIAGLGWHIQLHMTADQIVQEQARIASLPCPVVFDHMGRLPPAQGLAHPAFAVICALVEADKAWVKLSGTYLNTVAGPPTYHDVAVVACAFLDRFSERLVWGSDWPHVTEAVGAKPDDALLCDLLFQWAGERRRAQVLVSNPERLYDFR